MSVVDETRQALVQRLNQLRAQKGTPTVNLERIQAALDAYDSYTPRGMAEFQPYSMRVNGVEVRVLAKFEQAIGRHTHKVLAYGHPGIRVFVALEANPSCPLVSFRPLRREAIGLQSSNWLAGAVERIGASRLSAWLGAVS